MNYHWGNQLSKAIKNGGYNKYAALALALDVSESTISRWATGKSISIDNAIRLCDEMNISMDWLFRSTDDFEMATIPTQHDTKLSDIQSILTELPPDAIGHLVKFIETLKIDD